MNYPMKLPLINQRTIIFVVILAIISLFWFGTNPGARAQGRFPKPSGHVNDFADVLDATTRQRLEKVLENLKERTGIDFVIATVKSSGAEDLYDYSLRIANEWNIGVSTSPKKLSCSRLRATTESFWRISAKARGPIFPTV